MMVALRNVFICFLVLINYYYMKFIIVVLLLLNTSISFCQGKSDSARVFFTYGFGYHHQSFDGLKNRLLNRPEYERPGNSIFSFNAGWNVERNHLLFDVNFVFGNSFTGDADKRSSSISLFGTGLNLGYNFSNNQNIRIYPFAGISYNVYMVKLNKDLSAIPFDSVLQSNAVQQRTEPLTFTNGLFCYQAGFGIDFTKQKERYRHSIGIRASYNGSFSREIWRINEIQLLQNGPSDKVSQFNVSLQFGLGRNRRAGM